MQKKMLCAENKLFFGNAGQIALENWRHNTVIFFKDPRVYL